MTEEWERGWQAVVDRVGSDVPAGVHSGADAVERGAVRRYLEPLELDCALHYDAEVARQHGYRDVIAPYTSTLMWCGPAMWEPGMRIFTSAERDAQPARSPIRVTSDDFPPEATGYFATDMSMTFARPPVVGDLLGRRRARLVDVALKQTRVGRGALLTSESDVVDLEGGRVATVRSTMFVYEPVPSPLKASGTKAEPVSEAPRARVLDQRCVQDVVDGEALEPVAFPLTVYRLVMAAGANRDFNSIHHNSELAKASGAPEMYANTLLLQGMWERSVRAYIGNAGTIEQLSGFRMGSFNTVGDTVVVHGRVSGVERETGRVMLTVWSTSGSGVSVGPGTVVVRLPIRP